MPSRSRPLARVQEHPRWSPRCYRCSTWQAGISIVTTDTFEFTSRVVSASTLPRGGVRRDAIFASQAVGRQLHCRCDVDAGVARIGYQEARRSQELKGRADQISVALHPCNQGKACPARRSPGQQRLRCCYRCLGAAASRSSMLPDMIVRMCSVMC